MQNQAKMSVPYSRPVNLQAYHVKTPFVAIYRKAEGVFESVTLEPGEIISVQDGHTVLRSGLVDLLYNGTVLTAYLRDIEDRAERVEAQAE